MLFQREKEREKEYDDVIMLIGDAKIVRFCQVHEYRIEPCNVIVKTLIM